MSHVRGYFRKDGTFVPAHEDRRQAQPARPPVRQGPPPAPKAPKKFYPNAQPHPQQDEHGRTVFVNEPSTPSPASTWGDPDAIATFVPGGPVPKVLNGVPFAPWTDAPTTPEDWDVVEGQDEDLEEDLPPFEPGIRKPAAGVVVEEADGRCWVIHPTNGFGGYDATFPKGRLEDGINMQASAIKEAFEESGLQVEITGFLMDVSRSMTHCRYYRARRVGGTPAAMGWESQAVSLVPRDQLYGVLNQRVDYPLAEALGAGTPPPEPEPEEVDEDEADEAPEAAPEPPKKKSKFGWLGNALGGRWGWS